MHDTEVEAITSVHLQSNGLIWVMFYLCESKNMILFKKSDYRNKNNLYNSILTSVIY